MSEPLTGRQLRKAVEHNLPVRVKVKEFDPTDEDLDEITTAEVGEGCVYIAWLDFVLDDYEDYDPVYKESDTCTCGLYPVPGVDYEAGTQVPPREHKFQLVYSIDDDGVWLSCSCGGQENLGFEADPIDAVRSAAEHLGISPIMYCVRGLAEVKR